MIQIYLPSNTNFDANGDMTLFPTLCDAESELGKTWVLNITHPLDDDERWKYITEEAVLSVPTFMGEKQLYRIDEVDKSDIEISAKAYPVFFDSADEVFLMDTRQINKNGQEALDEMMTGSKYSGISNIAAGNTAYFVRRNLLDAINGANEPTFVGVWGGEPLYDNFKVIINERAGGDYGAQVRYGLNMEHVNCKVSMSNVVTRIVPIAYNGRMFSAGYVDSPLINNYAKVYTKEIKFDDVKLISDLSESEDAEGLVVCNTQEELDAALNKKCNEQFNAGLDLPAVTIDVDMIALENTEEYKDFKDLVKVNLGDTVGCYNSKLDITIQARAIKIKWDCISNSIKAVTLGEYEDAVIDKFSSTISRIENIFNSDGTVMAERVQGILDGIRTQLRYQKNAAQKQDVRAILFEDLDTESSLYGALAIGTQGLQIANKRTADGRAWEWSTAITANGVIADAIITGLLADKTGKNYWDLDTGTFVLNGGNIIIKAKNFVLDESGNVVVSGRYEVEYVRTVYAENYTEEDNERAQRIAIREIEPTEEDTEKYDFIGTGVDARCLLFIKRMILGYDEWYSFRYKIVIDPSSSASLIRANMSYFSSSNTTEKQIAGGVKIGGVSIKAEEFMANKCAISQYVTYTEDGYEKSGATGDFTLSDGTLINVHNGIITGIF